jgi:hypothetical protein
LEVNGQLHAQAILPLRIKPKVPYIGGWVDPIAGVEAVEKGTFSPCRFSNPDH